jgi:hypothetical protein
MMTGRTGGIKKTQRYGTDTRKKQAYTRTCTVTVRSPSANLTSLTIVPSANLATSSVATGNIVTGGHYALMGSSNVEFIEEIIARNAPIDRKITLAVAENPGTLSTGTACVADSGCTTHFFKSRGHFSSYTALEKAAGQSSKEGTSFTVLGMGTVQMKVIHNNLEHTLTFKDALHAPDVTVNLISISQLDLGGWDIVFGGQKTCFFKDKKEIFGGNSQERTLPRWRFFHI